MSATPLHNKIGHPCEVADLIFTFLKKRGKLHHSTHAAHTAAAATHGWA
jgi:hypothetical protein